MRNFTTKHRHVLAVQIYEYTIKHYKIYTLFTVHHKYFYVSESFDINALLQIYYRIPKELYDDYIAVKVQLGQGVLMEENVEVANAFCLKHLTAIQDKPLEHLTEEDAITVALVQVILDTLSYLLGTDYSLSLSDEMVIQLDNLKRTGILKGIEMKELYAFEYKGVGAKVGRTYVTNTIEDPELFNSRPHIMLMTLNPDYLPEDSMEQSQELRDLGREFVDDLQKELKIRYNETKYTH